MMASSQFDFLRKSFLPAVLVASLTGVLGCGDESSRLAGTIELPSKERGRPDVKQLAKAKGKARAKGAVQARNP